jgi:hypothetical protein
LDILHPSAIRLFLKFGESLAKANPLPNRYISGVRHSGNHQ